MMEDKNQNMIPDNIDRLIIRVGLAVSACLGTYAGILAKMEGQSVPMWLAIAVPVLPLALGFFSLKDSGGAA